MKSNINKKKVVDYCFTSPSLAAAGHGAQRSGKHAVVFAARNDAAEAAIDDSFCAAGAARPSRGKNNGATTIDSFTALQPRLSTTRERRAYRCWAPVTGGKKHYTKTPLRKDFPSTIDSRDLPMLYCRSFIRDSVDAAPTEPRATICSLIWV